ncbi:MAG: PQQ-binding-like beta-propeller repeat protein [Salinivirgaceae bacterium]
MKKIVALLFLAMPFLTVAQSSLEPHSTDLYLKVIDVNEDAIPFFNVWIKASENSQPQYSITDSKGNAQFKVITGNNYLVFINDSAAVATLTIPINSLSFVTQKVSIQRLSSEIKQAFGKIDTIDQSSLTIERPDPGNIFFKIGLVDHLNQPVKNKEVRIFNAVALKVYKGKTNSYGFVRFHVPGKTKFSVGVDQFENFDTISVAHHSLGIVMTFVPTKVKETEIKDTIRQESDSYMRATTERVLSKIYLRNHENKPLAGEDVYFNVIGSTKVYAGKTGRDGVLTVILPKGFIYELNFKYERAMKRFDFPMSPTLYSTSLQMTYIGSKKVEEFYRTANREGDFRTEFMEGKTTQMQLEPGVFEKTARGFNLNFPDNGPILTPAIVNKKLFVSSGYYSPNIYCIDAELGTSQWGIQLAENGPSVLVIEQGMLLINTQSCTLYAIDIETGILAWSKWLGPVINHSPTVYNGKVYAAYPDELGNTSENFVLASFDIKTGAIVWQSRLKNEPLSAPVAIGNHLFITDLGGWLYHFDAENGNRLAILDAHATVPPVFNGKSLWVSIQKETNQPISQVVQFNPENLSVEHLWTEYTDSVNTFGLNSLSSEDKMSYSRSRLLIDKGICYQINRNGLQAFSPVTGKTLWTIQTRNNLKYNPILTFAGKNILASVNNLKLALINPSNGQKIKEFYTSEILSSEPAIANGWLYCGTKNGKLIAINTKDKTIDGWNQWGMSGGHNPVRE